MSTNYDELDGRVYAQHLQLQQQSIQRLLEKIRSAVYGAAGCETAFQEAGQHLRELRTELQRDFAEESGGGCLDEAVSRCPRLAHAVQELEQKYPPLLASVDRLIAKMGPGPVLGLHRREVDLGLEQLSLDWAELETEQRRIAREAFHCDDPFSAQEADAP